MTQFLQRRISIPCRPWYPYIGIAAAGVFLYLPAVFYGFTYFDDVTLIVRDARFITHLGNLWRVFGTDVFRSGTVAYRPMLAVSFILDAAWGGLHPWAYHLTNIAIHLAAALLLYRLLAAWSASGFAALPVSLWFLVHPLNAQAVAWVPGRNDSLLGSFALLSLIGLQSFVRNRRGRWLAVHLAAWALALLTKETAIVLPLAFLIMLRAGEGPGLRPRLFGLCCCCWALIGFAWLMVRNRVIIANADLQPMVFNTLRETATGFAGYLGKAVFPLGQSVVPQPHTADLWLGAAAMAVCALLFSAGIKDRRIFALGLAMALLSLSPNIMRGTSYTNFLEHRMYLPLIGLSLMLSQASLFDPARRRAKPALLLALMVIGGLAAATAHRLPVYRDSIALWNDVMESSPSMALPYATLGSMYIDLGQHDIAEPYLLKARRLEPGNKDTYNNLGIVYQSTGRMAQAEQAFLQGIAIAPRSSSLRYSLGLLYQQAGRMEQAKAAYRKAIISRGDNVMALVNLGMIEQLQGRQGEAERWYRRALAVDPRCAQAWNNIGVIFAGRGMPDSARYYVDQARRGDDALSR